MRLAISEARRNLVNMRGGPFGAVIVKGGRVLAVARNTVLKDDATAHAEMNAIRIASRKLKTFDLKGCHMYSTCEPCPMCFAAIHWSRIGRVIFGARIGDAARCGFNELHLGSREIKRLGKSRVGIVAGFLRGECRALFKEWGALPHKKFY